MSHCGRFKPPLSCIIQERELVAIAGGGVTGLFWPAMQFAKGFRRDNIRIRMFELSLSMAKTPEEAAMYLREATGIVPSTRKASEP